VRLPHEGAGYADVDSIVNPLPCPFNKVEALSY
jgi:hypothetical protein